MPDRILKPGPAAWIVSLLLSLGLIAIALAGLLAGLGFVITYCFFFAGIVGIWMAKGVAFGETAWLELSEPGFTRKTPFGSFSHHWVEVGEFRVAEAWPGLPSFPGRVPAFSIRGKPSRGLFDAINPAKRFGHNYDMEPDHLVDLLNDYRVAALRAASRSQDPEKSAENSPQDHD